MPYDLAVEFQSTVEGCTHPETGETMTTFPCPECGKGRMATQIIPHLEKRFEGVKIQITNAAVERCTHCGEEAYSAQELHRWKKIKQARIAELARAQAG